MRYYIKMYNKQFNTIKYKRYKCIDGWSTNKEECWKFTQQSAMNIIERLKLEYRKNINNIEFTLELA